MCATLRFTQKPRRRSGPLAGMDIIAQGRNISTLQPVAVCAEAPCHGPSHWLVKVRSAATFPSASEPPRLTENQ